MFQLILSPIRDWNTMRILYKVNFLWFQLILSPIRDWNNDHQFLNDKTGSSN